MTGSEVGSGSGSAEVLAFSEAIHIVPMDAVTACRGWTVHDIVAHLTAGAEALADQAEAHLAGAPVPPFGSWEERDARFRAVDTDELRTRFVAEERRMSHALAMIAADGPDTVIAGGGWGFTVDHLAIHMRQEFALHRWDIVGDDGTGLELLASPEFLDHSVTLMDEWLLARGVAADASDATVSPVPDFTARIGCSTRPDVVVEVRDGVGSMRLDPPDASAPVEVDCADPAAQLLFVWGRHPSGSGRMTSPVPTASLMRLTTLLSGF